MFNSQLKSELPTPTFHNSQLKLEIPPPTFNNLLDKPHMLQQTKIKQFTNLMLVLLKKMMILSVAEAAGY